MATGPSYRCDSSEPTVVTMSHSCPFHHCLPPQVPLWLGDRCLLSLLANMVHNRSIRVGLHIIAADPAAGRCLKIG
jgi:hypothetical protein